MPPRSAQKTKPTTHQFNTPESEAVLGLQRLLIKVIGAKELPPSNNAQRRTCSAEVQLVGSGGAPLEGNPLHGRTGPPNHFSTVKDTAPVWNAEFVAELSDEMLNAGAKLRIDVWDDATSPPVHMGVAEVSEQDLSRMVMRDEERTLALKAEHISSLVGSGGGALKVRLAHVDVRRALAMLPQAEAETAAARERWGIAERDQGAAHVGVKLLATALQEEEVHAANLRQSIANGDAGSAAQVALQGKERMDARLTKAREDADVMLGAVREEKKAAMDAIVGMHNQTLAAFKQDLQLQVALPPMLRPTCTSPSPPLSPLPTPFCSLHDPPKPPQTARHPPPPPPTATIAGGARGQRARFCARHAACRVGGREGDALAGARRGAGGRLRVGRADHRACVAPRHATHPRLSTPDPRDRHAPHATLCTHPADVPPCGPLRAPTLLAAHPPRPPSLPPRAPQQRWRRTRVRRARRCTSSTRRCSR